MLVNIFSRTAFQQTPIREGEYYICINATGGTDSEIIISDSHYVKNMWFDDCLTTKTQWGPDIQDYYLATAITFSQAFELYKFIETIPSDAVVNIYCSKGRSRSGAVGTFLKNEFNATVTSTFELYPNRRVLAFLCNAKNKFIQPIKYNFSFEELVEYYNTLEKNFQSSKWEFNPSEVNGSEKHKLNGLYGWGIQSNLENLEQPCPPYDVHKNRSTNYRNTKLVFGFAQKLLERFPYGRQMGIAVHPPGASIKQHLDNDEYVKIHFPIISNSSSYFSFGEYNYVLEPGQAYLIDTRFMHGTDNQGDCNRVHLLLKLPYDKIEDALK